ncbi:MAG: ATP-dependent zinc metalloprotease FtsH [Acidimicrobiales bacterium]
MCIPLLLAVYATLMYLTLPRSAGEEASLGRFLELSDSGEIERAVLLNQDSRVLFVADGREYWTGLPSSQEYQSLFLENALALGTPLDIDQQELKSLLEPATYILPALIIVSAFLMFFLLMRGGSGASPFLKAAARRGAADRSVTFADVAGLDEAINEVREVRDYLMAPERFQQLGAEAPRGILLVGPPGTGKTLLARAVAGEAGVPFFSMSGTDFVEMYVGVGAARVRDLFRQVRERAPAILFIDELDAVGRSRVAGAAAGQDERDQTLNQLLVELDGFERDTGVVLVGATNRPDVLDPALLRRGRFDRQVVVDRPDRSGRLEILKVHARGKPLDPSVDLGRLAAQTPGFTGADLASVLNEAALLTARHGGRTINQPELERAVERIMTGSEGRTHVLSQDEKRTLAYHEAGHAIVGWTTPAAGPVTKISIVSRGRVGGFTQMTPDEERFVVSREEMKDRLAVLMGGVAAEELALGQPSNGGGNDLRRATTLARRMVCELGMSEELGRRTLGVPSAGPFLDDGRLDPDYSAEVAAKIDVEIARLGDEAFSRATAVLSDNRGILDELAALLIERETLREDDLVRFSAAVVAGPAMEERARLAGGPRPSVPSSGRPH